MKTKKIRAIALFLLTWLISPKTTEAPTINSRLESKIKSPVPIFTIDVRNILGDSFFQELKKTKDYKTEDFHQDSDDVLLARMLLGETEYCSDTEKIAVAYTAINRINDGKKWNGETLKNVILTPYQYSCFNDGMKEALKEILKNPLKEKSKEFLECLGLAREILAGKYKDPTSGATHYLNPNHPDLKGKTLPNWTRVFEEIGRIENGPHIFYKEN